MTKTLIQRLINRITRLLCTRMRTESLMFLFKLQTIQTHDLVESFVLFTLVVKKALNLRRFYQVFYKYLLVRYSLSLPFWRSSFILSVFVTQKLFSSHSVYICSL